MFGDSGVRVVVVGGWVRGDMPILNHCHILSKITAIIIIIIIFVLISTVNSYLAKSDFSLTGVCL